MSSRKVLACSSGGSVNVLGSCIFSRPRKRITLGVLGVNVSRKETRLIANGTSSSRAPASVRNRPRARKTRQPLILTSNKAFGEWGQVFGNDPVLASAALDRILHQATVIHIRGDSYRLKSRRQAGIESSLPV